MIFTEPFVVEFYSRTTNINSIPVPSVPAAWLTGALISTGSLVASTQPVDEPENVVASQELEGVEDTLYDRILIEPSVLSLGNLLSDQTRTIYVWNGFRQTHTLEDFELTNGDGISVTEPVTPPAEIAALQQLAYVVTVSTVGPSSISATATWTIEGVEYDMPISGQRLIVFSFPANWAGPLEETLEWKTDIIRSFSGKEQRRAVRVKPRLSLDFNVVLNGSLSRLFDNQLWAAQNRLYAVPLWQDKTRLSSGVVASASVLNVPTETFGFAVGGLVLLYSTPKLFEAVEISAISSTQLTLARPVSNNWPAGTLTYPIALGKLPSTVQTARRSDNLVTFSPSFRTEPGATDPYLPVVSAPATYQGYELFVERPDWSGGLDAGQEFLSDAVDYDRGPIEWLRNEELPRPIKQHKWLLKNRTQIRLFKQFLARRNGRQVPVYLPTWHQDFELISTIGPSDSSFLVTDDGFLRYVGVNGARRHLYIQTRNNGNFSRTITNVVEEAGALRVTIDTSLGVTLAPSGLRAMSLLCLYRLASDVVTISWQTDTVAQVQINFMLVDA